MVAVFTTSNEEEQLAISPKAQPNSSSTKQPAAPLENGTNKRLRLNFATPARDTTTLQPPPPPSARENSLPATPIAPGVELVGVQLKRVAESKACISGKTCCHDRDLPLPAFYFLGPKGGIRSYCICCNTERKITKDLHNPDISKRLRRNAIIAKYLNHFHKWKRALESNGYHVAPVDMNFWERAIHRHPELNPFRCGETADSSGSSRRTYEGEVLEASEEPSTSQNSQVLAKRLQVHERKPSITGAESSRESQRVASPCEGRSHQPAFSRRISGKELLEMFQPSAYAGSAPRGTLVETKLATSNGAIRNPAESPSGDEEEHDVEDEVYLQSLSAACRPEIRETSLFEREQSDEQHCHEDDVILRRIDKMRPELQQYYSKEEYDAFVKQTRVGEHYARLEHVYSEELRIAKADSQLKEKLQQNAERRKRHHSLTSSWWDAAKSRSVEPGFNEGMDHQA